MTDTWRDRLKYAKWRGISFLTENHDAKGGNRLVIHEFPGRNEPVIENLGLKAAGYKINAYFIGENYDQDRNAFLNALAVAGSDWLTHPWLGDLFVAVHDWSLHESSDKGGFCTVSVDFVIGNSVPLLPTADATDTALGAIQRHRAAIVLVTPTLSVDALTLLKQRINAALSAVRNALARARLPLAYAGELFGLVDQIKGQLADLLSLPQAYKNALGSLANVLGSLGATATEPLSDAQRVRGVTALTRLAVPTNNAAGLGAIDTPALRQTLTDHDLARAHFLLSSAMEAALADYTGAEARDAALNAIQTAIDSLLPTASDALFEALADARVQLMRALQSQKLTSAAPRDIVQPLPAAQLAYRLGISEAAFIERNAVRHPLFVQGQIYV
jgi:prophage DNA circulation protein